jgi:hypothetical protein
LVDRSVESWLGCVGAVLVLALGCGDGRGRADDGPGIVTTLTAEGTGGADDDGGDDDAADDDALFDIGGGVTAAGDEGGDCTPAPTDATLVGTVYAPNLQIPISGAVVYVTGQDPEPVPDGVYCAECVEIPCDAQFVLTAADGSFELPASSGAKKLIVQKGQFLHVADIEVVPGENAIAAEDSNLPGRWDPAAGMWIPRIAVVETEWDTIYNILAKIGMGDVGGGGELVGGSGNFDLYGQPQGGALLDDLEAMRQYHIIFVPCMAQENMGALTQSRLENIRQWVAEGGKWYVTDWANEYLFESFPSYQTMHHQASQPDLDLYHTTGTVLDADLLAWLQALPEPLQDIGGGYPTLHSLPQVELEDNWSGVDEIPAVIVQDMDGNDVDVGHHPWVEGPCLTCDTNATRPMTISASYGCGRMMFSTYHTNELPHPGLSPQELILLYIILEIGVCHEETPPEPPPAG